MTWQKGERYGGEKGGQILGRLLAYTAAVQIGRQIPFPSKVISASPPESEPLYLLFQERHFLAPPLRQLLLQPSEALPVPSDTQDTLRPDLQ